jgi:hypothetical protein
MSRAKWMAMDWYKISQFFQALGAFLTFVVPRWSGRRFLGWAFHLPPLSLWGELFSGCDYSPTGSTP